MQPKGVLGTDWLCVLSLPNRYKGTVKNKMNTILFLFAAVFAKAMKYVTLLA